jgi:small subunit ribosomal protein S8e
MPRAIENLRKRKKTGGRRAAQRKRRAFERDYYPAETELGEISILKRRARGGSVKVALTNVDFANVVDPSTGKAQKSKIVSVIENPSSRDYSRRKVITKGAILETELGKAKVVSRPGQHGVVNAVLMK